MRSDRQSDLCQVCDPNLASAHREAAAIALVNPYEDLAGRQRRHAWHMAEAQRIEANLSTHKETTL